MNSDQFKLVDSIANFMSGRMHVSDFPDFFLSLASSGLLWKMPVDLWQSTYQKMVNDGVYATPERLDS